MAAMSAGATFVHDFVAIDLPYEVVVAAFDKESTASVLEGIVAGSWRAEVSALDASRGHTGRYTDVPVVVTVGTPRRRPDAVIVPLRWRGTSTEWLPPLDADLEVAAFGPTRTHLHLYGQSEIGAGPDDAEETSLRHRLPVALVRHVLVLLTEHIALCAAAGSLVDPAAPDS